MNEELIRKEIEKEQQDLIHKKNIKLITILVIFIIVFLTGLYLYIAKENSITDLHLRMIYDATLNCTR